MEASFTFVIPARDEGAHLARLLSQLEPFSLDHPPIVVDNGSADDTAQVGAASGARVLYEPEAGKGHAVARGVAAAHTEWVFLCDADIEGLQEHAVRKLRDVTVSGFPLGRLAIGRHQDAAPVTTLVALPLLEALGVPPVSEPLGGLALVRKDFLLDNHLPGGWGFDIALTLAALRVAPAIPEVSCLGVSHRTKALGAYSDMARAVVRAVLQAQGIVAWDHADCIKDACSGRT